MGCWQPRFIQGRVRPAAIVVHNLVSGDGEQPGREVTVPRLMREGLQRRQECLRGQVLSIMDVVCAVIAIVVQLLDIAVVQQGKRPGIRFGSPHQCRFILS